MELSPNAFTWIGVGLALLGIGSQFSDYRSNWLTLAFVIVALMCFIPAIREGGFKFQVQKAQHDAA
jgi:hypothetical protein